MDLFATLSTGSGYWNPLAWFGGFVITSVIVWLIWSRGEKSYKKGTAQTAPYLSGNPEPAKGDVHIRAGNLYWGYTEALKGYYSRIVPIHTGILNDYVMWYIAVTALLIIVVVIFS